MSKKIKYSTVQEDPKEENAEESEQKASYSSLFKVYEDVDFLKAKSFEELPILLQRELKKYRGRTNVLLHLYKVVKLEMDKNSKLELEQALEKIKISTGDLKENFKVTLSTVTRHASALITRGLVKTSKVENSRMTHYTLTLRGYQVAKILSSWEEKNKVIHSLENLSEQIESSITKFNEQEKMLKMKTEAKKIVANHIKPHNELSREFHQKKGEYDELLAKLERGQILEEDRPQTFTQLRRLFDEIMKVYRKNVLMEDYVPLFDDLNTETKMIIQQVTEIKKIRENAKRLYMDIVSSTDEVDESQIGDVQRLTQMLNEINKEIQREEKKRDEEKKLNAFVLHYLRLLSSLKKEE